MYNYYSNVRAEIVSFNGIHYDNLIIKYILQNYHRIQNWRWGDITAEIKYFSDKVIMGNDEDGVRLVDRYRVGWTDVDLYLYWSKELRLSKKISLKSLGIQLGYPVVQELPFAPDTILKQEDLETLRVYNMTHDLGILRLLHDNLIKDIDLRKYIGDTLGVPCMSMDAPKIASEILLYDYCAKMNYRTYQIRKWRFERKTIHLERVLRGFDPGFTLPVFQQLFERMKNSYNTFGEDLLFTHEATNVILTYGVGGLHSVNENESYYSDDERIIMTSDVASLYPSLIINYNCLRFPEVLGKYKSVRIERLIAKKAGDKQKDTLFKLILNAISGMMDNQHNWLYFPEGALRMRLIGQLILTKCIEVCAIHGWQVISANTDGVEVLLPPSDIEKYTEVMNDTISKFEMLLEHEQYDYIVYKNVNNYICRNVKGELKQKGLFVEKPVLGNSVDTLVIAKALTLYYDKQIPIEVSITNPEQYGFHVYDYCKSNKIGRNFKVYHNGEEQQRLNRYFFKKNSAYLFKKKETGNLQHVNVGQSVELFNQFVDKPLSEYGLNYSYYISQARTIIDVINNLNQLKLF